MPNFGDIMESNAVLGLGAVVALGLLVYAVRESANKRGIDYEYVATRDPEAPDQHTVHDTPGTGYVSAEMMQAALDKLRDELREQGRV